MFTFSIADYYMRNRMHSPNIKILGIIRRCYATTYKNGGFSTSNAYTRCDRLTTVSDWFLCLETITRLLVSGTHLGPATNFSPSLFNYS
jgi:hypothetical protein